MNRDQQLLEEAYQRILESPVDDVSMTSQRTGQEKDRDLYSARNPFNKRQEQSSKMNTAMFENPKYTNYLKKNLFQKVPHNFEIILQDSPLKYKQLKELAGTNLETITVFMHNSDQHPLTPWIIGHRIGHIPSYAWRSKLPNVSTTSVDSYIRTNKGIEGIVEEYVKVVDPQCTVFDPYQEDTFRHEDIYSKLSSFKSARDRTIESRQEYITELYAQYLTTGAITFNRDLPRNELFSTKATQWMNGYFNALKGLWAGSESIGAKYT